MVFITVLFYSTTSFSHPKDLNDIFLNAMGQIIIMISSSLFIAGIRRNYSSDKFCFPLEQAPDTFNRTSSPRDYCTGSAVTRAGSLTRVDKTRDFLRIRMLNSTTRSTSFRVWRSDEVAALYQCYPIASNSEELNHSSALLFGPTAYSIRG
jgi:hypothetical protein